MPHTSQYQPGQRVLLVQVDGYTLPTPIPGVVDATEPSGWLRVTHDAHDCDPRLPVGTMGFDFWPPNEVKPAD